MTEPKTSWWIGKSREELDAEAKKRAVAHAFKQIGPLDYVGEGLRNSWDIGK